MKWKYIGISVDGTNFEIDGIDVWKEKWIGTNEKVQVKDPSYGHDFTFTIWKIHKENKEIKFAAGEFSNCIWGFYLPE